MKESGENCKETTKEVRNGRLKKKTFDLYRAQKTGKIPCEKFLF